VSIPHLLRETPICHTRTRSPSSDTTGQGDRSNLVSIVVPRAGKNKYNTGCKVISQDTFKFHSSETEAAERDGGVRQKEIVIWRGKIGKIVMKQSQWTAVEGETLNQRWAASMEKES
jgi:hypothetical protein